MVIGMAYSSTGIFSEVSDSHKGADVGPVGSGIGCPAVVGIVFSVNSTATQYCAISRLQMPRQEKIHDLHNILNETLPRYLGMNGGEVTSLPTKIIWYRA